MKSFSLRKIFIGAAFMVALLFFSNQTANTVEAGYEISLLNEINNERLSAGLSALKYSSKMELGADVRAEEASKVWSHTRPDGSDYYTADSTLIYGENLYKGSTSDKASVVSCWMASPTHKDNILFRDYKTCSVGVYEEGGMTYIALEFGY